MPPSPFHLSRPLQAAVYVSFGLLLLTGGAWMLAQARLDEPGWERIPSLALKIHGAAAMAALIVIGALFVHIRRAWQAQKNRRSGALLVAVNAFLVLSGYGLYYAGNEGLRDWLSRWHGWIGLGLFVLLPLHVVMGRLIVRRSAAILRNPARRH